MLFKLMSDMFKFLPMLILCSMLFIFFNHPLSCGMILIIQTILICLMTGMMNYNYWFSYILFLIMIGGMLILFIYMTSIASNEKFKFNFPILIISIMMIILNFMLLMMDNFYSNFHTQILDMKINTDMNNNLSMNKYFNYPNNLIMILMMNYLFLTLITIVKITNFSYGPLRQKF
nr:NADH dehydrogenase subunit 6 [Gallerucida bifasciata]